MRIDNINSYISYVSHKKQEYPHTCCGQKRREFKPLVLATSIIGTVLPMVLLRNRDRKFAKSMLDFDWDFKKILLVGFGSILGGAVGGLVSDREKVKKDRKVAEKKLQEGIYQVVSNIIVPTFLVDRGLKALKTLGGGNSKLLKAAVTLAGVSGGMLGGNILAKSLNVRLFPKSYTKRDIYLKDAIIHFDDLPTCLALNSEKFLHLEKLVPIGSVISGYETGVSL